MRVTANDCCQSMRVVLLIRSSKVYTFNNTRLSNRDINTFNSQYPKLTVKHMTAFHDRFLILDDTVGYHVGASLKDAGKKCFGISQIQDEQTIQDILNRL